MSRKPNYKKKPVVLDERFNNEWVSKFINKIMLDGKKAKAKNMLYKSIEILSQKTSAPGLDAFLTALENVMPKMEVKSRRVGGSTYQVPVEVKRDRGFTLATRWVIEFARKKKGSSFEERLASEFIDAFNKTGSVIKKCDDTHKMAEANKAFAHFRW
jgi:small subunit ribosomal protein S7